MPVVEKNLRPDLVWRYGKEVDMETEDETQGHENADSEAVRERDAAQTEEEEAHRRGQLLKELGAFAKEVVEDVRQFPRDVVLDREDPGRRLGEQQSASASPAAEVGAPDLDDEEARKAKAARTGKTLDPDGP